MNTIQVKSLAKAAGCSRTTLYKWAEQNGRQIPISFEDAVAFLEDQNLFQDRDGHQEAAVVENYAYFTLIEGGEPGEFRPGDIGQRLSRACGGVVPPEVVNHLWGAAERLARSRDVDGDEWTGGDEFAFAVATERALAKIRSNRGKADAGVSIISEWLASIPRDVWKLATDDLEYARRIGGK